MKSRESLSDVVDPDQALLFAAGILWEQALGGQRQPLPMGLKPPRQCSQPGSLNPVRQHLRCFKLLQLTAQAFRLSD